MDLDLDYTGGTVTAPAGGTLTVRVDCGNNGDDGDDDNGDDGGNDDGDNDDGDNDEDGDESDEAGDLPTTGARIAELAVIGALTVITGVSMVTLARDGGPSLRFAVLVRTIWETDVIRRLRHWIRRP